MTTLERNRMQPTRPTAISQPAPGSGDIPGPTGGRGPTLSTDEPAVDLPFASAEDFDVTGILLGVDPCESCYWWMPELYAMPALGAPAATAEPSLREDGGEPGGRLLRGPQAARTSGSRSTAAA